MTATMRVYKFLCSKYALQDISEHRIKLSEFGDMNDPFELLGSRFDDEVENILMPYFKSMGALCFSRNWSNPLLWSHYADKHKGICLGLDIPPEAALRPIYVDVPEMQDRSILIEAIESGQRANALIGLSSKSAEGAINRKLLLKYSGWSYEDEVRVLARLDGKNGEPSYFDFGENLALREVIVGFRCTVSRREIEEKLQGYSTPVKVIKASINNRTWVEGHWTGLPGFFVIEDPDVQR